MVTTRRQSGALANSLKSQEASQKGAEADVSHMHSSSNPSTTQEPVLPSSVDDEVSSTVIDDTQVRHLPVRGKESDNENDIPSRESDSANDTVADEHGAGDGEASLETHDDVAHTKASYVSPLETHPAAPETAVAEGAGRKHRHFGAEDVPIDAENKRTEITDDSSLDADDSDDSEDDAPEIVGTQDAAEVAKRGSRQRARLLEEQDSANRQRRKERDAVLKKQAEDKNKKRKFADDPGIVDDGVNESTLDEKTSHTLSTEQQDEVSHDSAIGVNSILSRLDTAKGGKLPDLLPAEFFEETEADASSPAQHGRIAPKAKRTKFVAQAEKKVKDKRLGSTIFRVARQNDTTLLAPKVSKSAKALKEAWLHGRTGKDGKNTKGRRPASGGFFVKR